MGIRRGADPFAERWVHPTDDGRFGMDLPSGVRAMLVDLVARLEELLRSDAEVVRRVFPTAYPEDAEKEAGFQALVRGELIDRHTASAALIAETADHDTLSEDELTSWMTAINALRLVFGTALDVSEDDEPVHDPDGEDAPARLAYHVLGELVDDIVHALRTTL
jgi:hypothetical protein